MPKEVIKENRTKKSAFVDVRWGSDHFDEIQIGVDRGAKFQFVNDEENQFYTGLYLTLYSEEQVDQLIKALKRAKRKTFS